MNLETRVRRFEQQIDAFEKLHVDELKKFQDKLEAYLRLQADEVRFLHEELATLKEALVDQEYTESSHAPISK